MLLSELVVHGVGTITVLLLVGVALRLSAYTRLGLLASMTMLWMRELYLGFPLWSDPSAWFFGESAAIFVLGALPAIWGAWASAHGRPVGAAPA